ncbi:hypothetical protein LC040_07795 [Bacillus tianshenii]|nr:hypothetical protein LC040_07795 [Bacillus tianshenii]
MNFRTLLFNIERHCASGEWGHARILIEKNYDTLITPEKRKLLSTNALNLLEHVVKDFEKKKQAQANNEANDQVKKADPVNHHHKRKLEAEKAMEERRRLHLIQSINDYCKDFSWRRARNLIEENLGLLEDETYRKRLNSEAKVLYETIYQTHNEAK